ncbi:MAG TPA: hypothetical protein DCS07_09660, partial [Bdellovibrionales bacterium]|nr:hypothetical protein [Bdellovibrionales bacterium]
GKQAQEPAPLELLIDRLDLNLARVQNVTNLLSRFPDVAKEKWSLLDKALENLDSVTQSRDVHLYKVFIRVVYLKAFLGQEVVSDSDFGRKRWACKLDLEKLRENFVWITQNLVAASEDFRSVFPSKATSLDGMHGQLAGVLTILEEMKSSGPVGSNTGLLSAQLKLQSTFRCDTSSSAF